MKVCIMRFHTLFFGAVFLMMCCSSSVPADNTTDIWAGARWIAYERLDDSLKQVPAVHGLGDELGDKCVKRSVVPIFRKEFQAAGGIESASIDICGLGHYELYLNGERVGDRFLSPGWSLYQKRRLYNTYDITNYLKTGDNALGVIVGNGFFNVNRERYRKLVVAYGYPQLIFHVTIRYGDGSEDHIVSDGSCSVTPSPITFSSIYGGEDYDARLEQDGWDSPGFYDTAWQSPVIIDDAVGALMPEKDYPLKVMDEFQSRSVTTSKTGRTIYDFGQNASGIMALKVRGNRGARIRIRPDELVNDAGDITQKSGGGPYELNYTLKGEGVETWRPRFTYYGFRFADVEIIEPEDARETTEILELTMLHTRNSSPTVGAFSCSDSLFNRIFELINWGIRSNMASVSTDCPHREKLGWLEQSYLIGPSMHYNYDIRALYRKIVDDMMDSQLENGLVPDIAPEYVPFAGGFRDSPEWGSAAVIIPWLVYRWYGDRDVLETAYPMMKRYVDYLWGMAHDNILDHGLGDWFDLGPNRPGVAQLTPKAVTATSIYYYDLRLVTEAARLLGHERDAETFDRLSGDVRDAFLAVFYNPRTGLCSTGSQTAYAMPLYTGLIPERDRTKVLNNLVDEIVENDYALTSGDIGYHFLVRVLSENGRSDILYRMNNRSDRPGYGYQLKKGATALTESWAALPEVSNNHMMLGHLMEWFYAGLGGIYQAENSVAYRDIVIAPKPVGDISWVTCSYNSVRGVIASDWRIEKGMFTLDVTVPGNASATIVPPEGFRNAVCTRTDRSGGNTGSVPIRDGVFTVTSGMYRVIAKFVR